MMKSLLVFVVLGGIALSCAAWGQNTQPQWRNVSSLPLALSGHRSVTLHTGEVLVCGGVAANGAITTTSQLYSNGAWVPTNNQLGEARAYHALVAVRANNGESLVFAIGGYKGTSTNASAISSVEVLSYTATTKAWTWRKVGDLPVAVGNCAAAYNKKGFIVVSGGRTQSSGAIGSGVATVVSSRIALSSMLINKIGDMATARSEHACLMLYGPNNDSTVLSACGEGITPSTEILSGTAWDNRANPPQFQQRYASSFTDRGEIARIVGGIDETGAVTNRGEWYDTKSGWRFMPRMQTPRAKAFLTQVAGLRDSTKIYMIVGGQSTASTTPDCELFSLPDNVNPNGAWSPFSTLVLSAAERTIAINGDNLPLVTGGSIGSSVTSSTEMFQPFRANDVNLGQQEIGGETARQFVKVENTWLLPVMLRNIRIPNTAEFRLTNSQDSIVLQPNGILDIDVRFRPNTIGQRSAWLYFDVGPLTDSVQLKGEGIKSTIAILAASKDFGSRLLKTDTTICFYALRNEGKDTTVIDSVTVEPPNAFSIVSPVGRVRIPPNDSLQICIRFKPTARQPFSSGAIVHITDRAYPVSLIGKGIRAFVGVTQQRGCDTVSIAIGDSLTYTLTLSNNSDVGVTIDSAMIRTALGVTFRVKDKTQFPFSLAPGASRQIDIVFKPQREAEEKADVEFINNGDTVCIASLCFVPRNRTITFNFPESKNPVLCTGDSLVLPVVLENPSNFDSLSISSAQINSSAVSGYVISNVTTTIAPRATFPASFAFVARQTPQQTGAQQATIVLNTNQGTSQYTVNLTILPGMSFSLDNAQSTLSQRITIPVRRSDNLNSVGVTDLVLRYNGSVLAPKAIVNLSGKNYINQNSSTLQSSFGTAHLHIVWNQHPATPDAVFGIEFDVLLGNDTQTTISLSSDSANTVCVNQTQAVFNLQQLCGGRSALISSKNVLLMRMMPNPVSNELAVQLIAPVGTEPRSALLQIRNVLGDVVATQQMQAYTATINLTPLSAGLYFCELLMDGQLQSTQPITILR